MLLENRVLVRRYYEKIFNKGDQAATAAHEEFIARITSTTIHGDRMREIRRIYTR